MGRGCWSVYVHINKINNKKYIGITKIEPSRRWGKNGIGYKNQYFYRAIKKYGWDSFKHIVMYQNFTEDEAKEKEKLLIRLFDTRMGRNGYNMTDGGDGTVGCIPSNETLRKLSESHVGQIAWNKGMKYHSENISKSIIKLWQQEDYKEKQRKAHLGNKQTEETKRKISDNSTQSRKIMVFSYKGDLLYTFDSIAKCRQYFQSETDIFKMIDNRIRDCCVNKIPILNGYICMYKDEYSVEKIQKRVESIKDIDIYNSFYLQPLLLIYNGEPNSIYKSYTDFEQSHNITLPLRLKNDIKNNGFALLNENVKLHNLTYYLLSNNFLEIKEIKLRHYDNVNTNIRRVDSQKCKCIEDQLEFDNISMCLSYYQIPSTTFRRHLNNNKPILINGEYKTFAKI